MLETCLGWEDYVANIQIMSRDMIKLQLTLLSRAMSFVSRRSDIMLWLLYIKKLQYMYFQFDYLFAVSITT